MLTQDQWDRIIDRVMSEPLPPSTPSMDDVVEDAMSSPVPSIDSAEDTSPFLVDDERINDDDGVTDHLPAQIVYEMYGRLSLYFFCRDRWFTRYQTALQYRRSIDEPSLPIVRTYMTYRQAQILDLVR